MSLRALAAFVLLVGPDPSVLRAAVMGGLAALSLLTGRSAVSLATLSGAVIVLVVARPALAAEYGFVLSVLATAGIVVSGRPLTRWLGTRVPEVLAVAVAIPATAFSTTGVAAPAVSSSVSATLTVSTTAFTPMGPTTTGSALTITVTGIAATAFPAPTVLATLVTERALLPSSFVHICHWGPPFLISTIIGKPCTRAHLAPTTCAFRRALPRSQPTQPEPTCGLPW